jgi:hypothetical protein
VEHLRHSATIDIRLVPAKSRAREIAYTSLTVWELIFMLLVLKIPLVYLGWVVWWAIRAVPEPGTQGGTDGLNWKPWRGTGSGRPRRGGPHEPRTRRRRPVARRGRVGA